MELDLPPSSVIAGNGSTQLIYLLFRALRPRHPCIVIPTFSEIANAAAACGSPAVGLRLAEAAAFALTPGAITGALDDRADAIFMGRPNSPTGTLLAEDAARAIARQCAERNAWCVFDEAFIEFTNERSMARFAIDHDHVIVIRSMTKIFAMPGLRLGYAVGAQSAISRMRECLEPWSVSIPAERVAFACLEASPSYLADTLRTVAAERDFLESGLKAHPRLSVFPSTANFLMVAVAGERLPGEFGAWLKSDGIAIRDLVQLPGCRPGLYRIGIRQRPDNQRLIAAAHRWHSQASRGNDRPPNIKR
jgi:threonine-phosphate decarboxylase